MPEHETIVGGFSQCRANGAATIKNAGFVRASETGPPCQRGVAEGRLEQVVQVFDRFGVVRLDLLQQVFEQGLFFQRVDVMQRGHLLLAFYQAVQGSGQWLDVFFALAAFPYVSRCGLRAHTLPRMPSTNCSTRIRPWILVICCAGTPPVTWLEECMKWRIQSWSPPVRANSAR